MRWRGRRQSKNVIDRRGMPTGRLPGRRVALGGGGGCLGIVLVLLFILLGGDPALLLQQAPPGGGGLPAPVEQFPNRGNNNGGDEEDDPLGAFVGVVLADTEDVWQSLFASQLGRSYNKTDLVLFEDRIDSACGFASAAVGPFYCPADRRVYIDLSFFGQLRNQLGAPGDFAMAYVVAHEVAHHVQNEIGIMSQVNRAKKRASETEANRLSVRLELQADYLAGVWAHHAHKMKKILEAGDVEEAMRAATAIGDDKLQKSSRGYVVPDSFTHGTSKQRLTWFRRGLETGDLKGMQELFERSYGAL